MGDFFGYLYIKEKLYEQDKTERIYSKYYT